MIPVFTVSKAPIVTSTTLTVMVLRLPSFQEKNLYSNSFFKPCSAETVTSTIRQLFFSRLLASIGGDGAIEADVIFPQDLFDFLRQLLIYAGISCPHSRTVILCPTFHILSSKIEYSMQYHKNYF